MSDNDVFNHYETTEHKMSNDSNGYNTSRKKTCQSSPDKKLSKNGLYYHEPNGDKSFGTGTSLLILLVLLIGAGITLGIQDEHPMIGLLSIVSSWVIVFGVILGGKKTEE